MTDEERRNLYMQNPFDILTKEKLDRLERHCKKAIHYERGHIQEEHQVTLELIYKYQEQQTELEKKDKIIDKMVEKLSYVEDLKLDVCVNCKEDCRIPRNQGDCIKTDCIKEYFKKKVEEK